MSFHRISVLFAKYPKSSNAITGLLTFGCGDLVSQGISKPKSKVLDVESYDFHRVVHTAALGAVMNGMTLFSWYSFLDRALGTCMKSKSTVFLKMAADQIFYAPLAIAAFFMSSSVYRSNYNSEKSVPMFEGMMSDSFLSTYGADCSVWPALNFITFRYVPLHMRPAFVSCCQLVWQSYMSSVANKDKAVASAPFNFGEFTTAKIRALVEEGTSLVLQRSVVAQCDDHKSSSSNNSN